jgi:hypothetical protein
MFCTGELKPHSNMAGIMQTMIPIIACCWLETSEKMNKPRSNRWNLSYAPNLQFVHSVAEPEWTAA